jgi:16S rRNA (uracil1498-N3)-methyltransferase
VDDAQPGSSVSRPRRFVIAPERIDGDRVAFDRAETRHMAAVLRLGPGDLVVAADGHGHDYTIRIEALGDTATGTVIGVAINRAESPLAITLIQGVPKGDKMEAIIRAGAELGLARLAPALTARTIVRLPPSRWHARARRWQRVARESAKQCGRAMLPEVETPRPLVEWLDPPASGELALCLWEGAAPPLGEILNAAATPPQRVRVVVGPEGGLAREEMELTRARGFSIVSLGPRILRTETAGPAIVAILQFTFGDLSRPSREFGGAESRRD